MTVRHGRIAVLCTLFVACAFGLSGAAPAPDAAPKLAPPEPPAVQLFRPRSFPGYDDPKTTLAEALEHIGKLYGVTIDLNEEAFKQAGAEDVGKFPIAAQQPIPKMGAASLDRALRKVLGRVNAAGGTTFMVRADHIEVTTRPAQVSEVWGQYEGPYLPLVQGDFEGRPLADALRELGEQAGVSVVFDARDADKGKVAVTASFTNLPLDTAVRVLADMAGLKSYHNDNVLYVSTRERNVAARPDANGLGDGPPNGIGGLALNVAQMALLTPVRGANFERRPLQGALQELVKPTPMRLIVDEAHVGDKANAPVTANLDGTNLDAAVRILADMAGLQAVLFDNVVYLTTRENALGFQMGLLNRAPLGGLGLLGGLPTAPFCAGKDGTGQ